MIDGIAAKLAPPTAAQMEAISDKAFNTLIRIAAHRLAPSGIPAPGTEPAWHRWRLGPARSRVWRGRPVRRRGHTSNARLGEPI